MRVFYLMGIMLVAFLPASSFARPSAFPTPGSAPRCLNAPSTVAGTFLKHRSVVPNPRELTSRASTGGGKTIVWCAPRTRAYIILQTFAHNPNLMGVAGNRIAAMLTDAVIEINDHVGRFGDGVIEKAPGVIGQVPRLIYTFTGIQGDRRSELQITERAGKHLTYGVLKAVLMAMYDFMSTDHFGAASFTIWVGTEEIGDGRLA